MAFIKTFLRKENICCLVFFLLFLASCKQDRTTKYVIENKAAESIRVYTTESDSVFTIVSNTSQTIYNINEFVGKDDGVAENYLYSIDSIKMGALKYKPLLNDTTNHWTKKVNSKNTELTFTFTVNNSDF
jgi:hypothetical protein